MYRAAGFILFLLFLILFPISIASADDKPVWLAVTTPGLAEGLKPLVEKRQQEGFEAVVSTDPVGEAIKKAGKRLAYLVLVGDDERGQEAQPWYVGAKRVKAYPWHEGQAVEFASDPAWGDLNGDKVPDVPVGRIPARTKEQVELIVGKILSYEKAPATADDLRLPFWGGPAGYGPTIDNMSTGMLLTSIKFHAPRWCVPWLICGPQNSVLAGVATDQAKLYTDQVRRGGVLAVLMGHGNTGSFAGTFSYTVRQAQDTLSKGPVAPPMVVFTCLCGDFTAKDCLTKAFLMLPGGPVATIGATAESHPLTNYYSGVSLLRALKGNQTRLGDVWMTTQREMLGMRNVLAETMLSKVEGTGGGDIDIPALKRDQFLMYALLGDPATHLKLPQKLEVTVERKGNVWEWKAVKPQGSDHLEAGYRAEIKASSNRELAKDNTEARRIFNEFNAGLDFAPITSLGAKDEWKGIVDKEGWLRLVATGGPQLYVGVVQLKIPAEEKP